MKPTLFKLAYCIKCTATQLYLDENKVDYKLYHLPHDFKDWNEFDIKNVEKFGILEDLKKTAPILVLPDGTKIVGQLRIMKWVKDKEK